MSEITLAAFLEWRTPRLGTANPSRLDNPVWEWLVRTGMNAWQATQEMGGPSAMAAGPGWCCQRFGQSTTLLPDGREVLIAGEHEDYYDPDFFIYNDVIVKETSGAMAFFGYPREVFPPTDFHSATLVDNGIVLIGNLGYANERRANETQVLRLKLDDFSVEALRSEGEVPAWIHGQAAALEADGHTIAIKGGKVDGGPAQRGLRENIDDWAFDLRSCAWTRRTRRVWQAWALRRRDDKSNHVWELRHLAWWRGYGDEAKFAEKKQELFEKLAHAPDLDALPGLYRVRDATTIQEKGEDEYNVFRVSMDGVVVRFTEDHREIRVMVEGELEASRLAELQETVRERLTRLEGSEWVIDAG